MFLVNTTFLVADGLEDEWVDWAYGVYVPAAVADGGRCTLLMRILSPQPEASSYALQVQWSDAAAASRWRNEYQPVLLDEMARRWQQRVLHFTTLMEEVERG